MERGTLLLPALGLATAVLMAVSSPGSAAAQWTPYVGISGSAARAPQPFLGACSASDDWGNLASLGGHVGIRYRQISMQAGYARGSRVGAQRCDFGPIMPVEDGVREEQSYAHANRGHLQPLTVRVGYSLAPTFTVYGGGGIEASDGDPLALAAFAFHGNGRIRLTGGVEFMYMATQFRHIEREFASFNVIRTTVLGESRHWKPYFALWLGFEMDYPSMTR